MTKKPASRFVYVTYIRTTPDRLWTALTSAEFTRQYWLGVNVDADWRVGGAWKLTYPDGRTTDTGEIVEFEPAKRLAIRWRNEFKPELKAEGWSLCTMEISRAATLSSSRSRTRSTAKTRSSLAQCRAAGRRSCPT